MADSRSGKSSGGSTRSSAARSSSSGSTRRKSTNGRSSSSRSSKANSSRQSSGRNTERQELSENERRTYNIIFGILLAASALFIYLSNFGIFGAVGSFFQNLQFGLFGITAYAFLPLVVMAVVVYLQNGGGREAITKIIGGILLFLQVGIIAELIRLGMNNDLKELGAYDASKLYEECGGIAENAAAGGGVIAGSLTHLSRSVISTVGTIFLVILLTVISLLLIFGWTLVSTMKSGKDNLKKMSEEGAEHLRERKRMSDEERARRIEERAQREDRRDEDRFRPEELRGDVADDEGEEKREITLSPRERREQERRRKEEERRLRDEAKENERILGPRRTRKVSGVTSNTELAPRKSANPQEMHEITLRDDADTEDAAVLATATPAGSSLHELSIPEEAYTDPAQTEETREVFEPVAPETVRRRANVTVLTSSGQQIGGLDRPKEQQETVYEPEVHTVQSYAEEYRPAPELPERPAIPEETPVRSTTRETADRSTAYTPVTHERPVAEFTQEPARKPAPAPAPAAARKNGIGSEYDLPKHLELLTPGKSSGKDATAELEDTARRLEDTLDTFGVRVSVRNYSRGPAVTRYELEPERGVKVSRIVNLADDIKLALAAADIRIEAPIPGTSYIGIEVPNKENSAVALRDLLQADEYQKSTASIPFAVGKDLSGKTVVADIARMPHMLIAGSTGSGKSVCINTLIMSILYHAKPDEVKLILVDPKVVELSVYNKVPHLLIPVVTDPKKAAGALQWAVKEMSDRYAAFADYGVRDLKGFNAKTEEMRSNGEQAPEKLPLIVIVVDELADLMMVAAKDVEESICRLAQLARAAGIHLILATQRPSVDVITGLIKANMPSRVAFAVSSGVDSRTILDMNGAEKLLGKGDMLFYPQGYTKPARVQGAFVSDEDVARVVNYIDNLKLGNVNREETVAQIMQMSSSTGSGSDSGSGGGEGIDELFEKAGRLIIEKDKASIGMLQRAFKIGFNRAARIMDQLCDYGVVGEEEGTKPRQILMTPPQFEELIQNGYF